MSCIFIILFVNDFSSFSFQVNVGLSGSWVNCLIAFNAQNNQRIEKQFNQKLFRKTYSINIGDNLKWYNLNKYNIQECERHTIKLYIIVCMEILMDYTCISSSRCAILQEINQFVKHSYTIPYGQYFTK
jgi:hypothetical protein